MQSMNAVQEEHSTLKTAQDNLCALNINAKSCKKFIDSH